MKLRQAVRGLFKRRKNAERRRAQTDAEKAREIELLVQSGVAANKVPPR
jgi:hypothetical protein